jgi:hypothetical protein
MSIRGGKPATSNGGLNAETASRIGEPARGCQGKPGGGAKTPSSSDRGVLHTPCTKPRLWSTIFDKWPPGDIDQRDTWQVDHIRPEETFGNILETMRRGPVHVTLCQSADAMAAYSRRDQKKGRLDGWRGRLENLFEPIILGNAIQLEPGQKEAFVLSHVAPEQWPWRCSDHDEEDHGGEWPNKKSKGSKQQSASIAPTTALTNGRR